VTTPPCDGCLDLRECWICSGDGCQRCGLTGDCHLCCVPPQVADLVVPPQPQPVRPLADTTR
jgi:hypothetical protein